MRKLHKDTIKALEWKLQVASDELELQQDESYGTPEDAAEWAATVADLEAVIAAGTVEALAASDRAKAELFDHLDTDECGTGDRLNAFGRNVRADLARAGYYETYDPEAVCTYRRQPFTVDGVKYE